MNDRPAAWMGFGEEKSAGRRAEDSGREIGKYKDLRAGQILSVRKACDKFLESRGVKQVPFRAFSLRRRGN